MIEKIVTRTTLPAVAALVLFLAAGCWGKGDTERFGEPAAPDAPRITLAELLADPEPYQGKAVVVPGHFAGNCEDGDFYFKDRTEIIEADPPSPEVLKLAKGTPIELYGVVKVRKPRAPEGSAKPAPARVRMAARGVEVRR